MSTVGVVRTDPMLLVIETLCGTSMPLQVRRR